MAPVLRDIRLAGRRLARAPLFTLVGVVTLATGIGANTAIFSVVNGVLLTPLPYDRPDELVSVWHRAPGLAGAGDRLPISEAMYFTYRSESHALADIGIADEGAVTITGGSAPERVASLMVTDGTLSLLRVEPQLGRQFTRADDAAGAPATVILGHGYWQRRFGGDRGVLGEMLTVDGVPHRIIGVLPRGFRVLQYDPAVYLAARFDPTTPQAMSFRYRALARLEPGVGIDQAGAELARLIPVAFERYPGPFSLERMRRAGLAPAIKPLAEDLVGDVARVLWILLGTVGLVLLLACANVANLFLVRAEAREREVAVHTALGAGRPQIVPGFLAESLLLGGLAGAVGTALAYGGLALLEAVGPRSLPRMDQIGIDGRVLGFTATISLLAGIAFGLLPALRYGRPDLHGVLKEGSLGSGTVRARYRGRNGLVVAQVALALVLLIGSGLMVRSVQTLREVDPGFVEPEQVLTFRLFIPEAEIPEPDRVVALERQILERVEAIPGVTRAGASWSVPMSPFVLSAPIRIEGVPDEPSSIPSPRRHDVIAPGFPEALGTPLVAGRTLGWSDLDNRTKVVLISENLAREEWGTPAAAIGKRIQPGGPAGDWHQIIGVLGNIRYDGVSLEAPPMVFWPLSPERFGGQPSRALSLAVRTGADPRGLVRAMERAVWSVNPNLPLANIRTLGELLEDSMARAAFATVMLSIAAGVALVLGLVGIYGVVSYAVSRRTREIGVRMALGARPADIRRMVIGQAALVTGAGVAVGLGGAVAVTRVMTGLLHGIRPIDLPTYGTMALVIAAVALWASWLPARRAVSIDPAIALRSE